MNSELNASLAHFAQSLDRFLERNNDFAQRVADLASGTGDRRLWDLALHELGLPALMIPVAHGGHNGGAAEAGAVMEALGRRLALDAFAEQCVVAPLALLRLGVAELLSDVAQGRARVALGFDEAGFSRIGAAPVARKLGLRFGIDGHVNLVLSGADASHLLLCAQLETEPALFLISTAAEGITRTDYTLIDGRAASDFVLDAVDIGAPLAAGDETATVLQCAHNEGIAAACAEALGVLRELLAMTIAYVRIRHQFGAPLGSLQAVQHRIADMALAIEKADAVTARARLSLGRTEGAAVAAAAKVVVNEALRFVGQSAVQLHGAMGTVEESAISHYFRRATVLEVKFGSSAINLSRYARAFALAV